ncbi:hypothetical protein GpartN1_g3866.t1 [Galdieria partita]|uniref:Serine aminopeptidase S33 domain-containing protein n=1 Tax=Galdieria partita TaxID=83374 RepID=A0A9C7PX52_9RHOD|nr:hypothetical protein GpartN1_g3866.t1 [Galdieria partita]
MGAFYSHLVFRPPVPASYTHEDFPITWIETKQNTFFPCTFIEQTNAYFTLLFSHGNGEDLGNAVSYLNHLCSVLKVNALAYDYTGYGLATGKPSEEACYANVEAAYLHLVNERNIPPERIIVFGRSLGSAPSIHIAWLKPVRGLILVSPLSSCIRVVRPRLHMTLPFDMFVNIHKISLVRCPVLIVHGCRDQVVPFSNGLDLYKRCRLAVDPLWITDGGHNNLELHHREVMIERYQRFLDYIEKRPFGTDQDQQRHSPWKRLWRKKQQAIKSEDSHAFMEHNVGSTAAERRKLGKAELFASDEEHGSKRYFGIRRRKNSRTI